MSLLPSMETLSVHCYIESGGPPMLASLPQSDEDAVELERQVPESQSICTPSTSTKVNFRASLRYWTSETYVKEQLRVLLGQLKLPHLQTVSISLNVPSLVKTVNRNLDLSSLVNICDEFRVPGLRVASFEIGSYFNGSNKEMDV